MANRTIIKIEEVFNMMLAIVLSGAVMIIGVISIIGAILSIPVLLILCVVQKGRDLICNKDM
jgi:hypothetical protein